MIIINLMLITLFIFSLILLSRVKIMFDPKYVQILIFIFVVYTPILNLIEGYKLGYTGISSIIILSIVFLVIFIVGYKRNKHIYSIHNVKQNDVVNIIKEYLEIKNIKYEVVDKEIHLPELCKTILVKGSIEINLDCREIKDMDFYNDLVNEVKVGIKSIKKRYFPIEGILYLILVGFLYWIMAGFLFDFLK